MKVSDIYHAELAENRPIHELPLFLSKVHAGHPSPADDSFDHKLDLNTFMVKRPTSTYFVRVTGDSMIGAGIHSGDILVVDRSLPVDDGKIVIAMIDQEFMVKRFKKHHGGFFLISENSLYPPIEVKDKDLVVWGVVTYSIHQPL